MVAQCAGCNDFSNWAALVIGLMAGIVLHLIHTLMLKLKLDDPLDAVAVHAGGGMLGVICAPIFKSEMGIFWLGWAAAHSDYDDLEQPLESPWKSLGINTMGLFAIMAWGTVWSFLLFGTLQCLKKLRIDRETEFKGNDITKHGESAYPASAWSEFQYISKDIFQDNVTATRKIQVEPGYH